MKEITGIIARDIVQSKEEIIGQAVTKHFGTADWFLQDIVDRVEVYEIQLTGEQHIFLDGKPILIFYRPNHDWTWQEFHSEIGVQIAYKIL